MMHFMQWQKFLPSRTSVPWICLMKFVHTAFLNTEKHFSLWGRRNCRYGWNDAGWRWRKGNLNQTCILKFQPSSRCPFKNLGDMRVNIFYLALYAMVQGNIFSTANFFRSNSAVPEKIPRQRVLSSKDSSRVIIILENE